MAETVITGTGKLRVYAGTVAAHIVLLILFNGSPVKTHIEEKLVLNTLNIDVIIDLVTVIVCRVCVVFGTNILDCVLFVTPPDVSSTINCVTVSLRAFE